MPMLFSISLAQGRRPYMEDTFIVEEIKRFNKKYKCFGVFDGHGGDHVSRMCREKFKPVLQKEMNASAEIDNSLRKAYKHLDEIAAQGTKGIHCGSTAVTLVSLNDQELWCANCGDSEGMIAFKNGRTKMMTQNHKVEMEDKRLRDAGATITNWDCPRINATLNVARSIGDHHLKKYVICDPYVKYFKINKQLDYILLASDGLWDVLDEKTVHSIITQKRNALAHLKPTELVNAIGYHLIEQSLKRGSTDNITCIFIMF